MSLAEQALSYVRAISPYQPGKPITELAREMGIPVDSIVKLASNENPLGMSPLAKAALQAAAGTLERYPDWVCDAVVHNPAWVEARLAKNPQWINEQIKRMSVQGDLFA